ncbi:hypothetical protein ACFE04_009239 [Oxalis oulophora]
MTKFNDKVVSTNYLKSFTRYHCVARDQQESNNDNSMMPSSPTFMVIVMTGRNHMLSKVINDNHGLHQTDVLTFLAPSIRSIERKKRQKDLSLQTWMCPPSHGDVSSKSRQFHYFRGIFLMGTFVTVKWRKNYDSCVVITDRF